MAFFSKRERSRVTPPMILTEMARLIHAAPEHRLGSSMWVGVVEFSINDFELTLPLDDIRERYIDPAMDHILRYRSESLSKRDLWFVGEPISLEYDRFKLELRHKYNGPCDMEDFQFRIWFTPVRDAASVPSHFWLGELAEDA